MKAVWFDTEPFLKAVYAFGEVVDGADPLDAVHVAVAINLSPEEVPRESSPEGTGWLANELRLSKGGFLYFWRSYPDPIWNHYIRGPVRIWSVDDGPDEQTLTALEARDLGSLKRLIPESADGRLRALRVRSKSKVSMRLLLVFDPARRRGPDPGWPGADPPSGLRSTGRPKSFSRSSCRAKIRHAQVIAGNAHVEQVHITVRPPIAAAGRGDRSPPPATTAGPAWRTA